MMPSATQHRRTEDAGYRFKRSGGLKTALAVILPAAAPPIVTGMGISTGIACLVIVAAEMRVGGTSTGHYVRTERNIVDLTSVIFSILMIGVVGLPRRAVAYTE